MTDRQAHPRPTSRHHAWLPGVVICPLVPFLAACGGPATPTGPPPTPTPPERSVVVDVPLTALIEALHEPLPTLEPTATAGAAPSSARPRTTSSPPRPTPSPPRATARSAARVTEDPAAVGDVIILTPVPCAMVSLNDTEKHGGCCPDMLRSGAAEGREFLTALSFDLTGLPMGVEVLYAGLELTGLDDSFLQDHESWYIQLIDLPPANDLGDLSFSQLVAAPPSDPGAAWRLRSEELAPGGRNTLQFGQQALDALALRLGQGKVTFRIEGPGGEPNLFAWQSCGVDAPRLRIGYVAMPGAADVRWETTAAPADESASNP